MTATVRAWDVEGPADGPAIVFLHGTQLSRAAWRPQVERLRATHRCITVDLPGHGVLVDEPFTLEAAVSLVENVIDAEAGGRAVVVGLSLGGYVGMAVAGHAPRRVRGLVLAGATMEPEGLNAGLVSLAATALERIPSALIRFGTRLYFRRIHRDPAMGPVFRSSITPTTGAVALRALVGGRFRDRLLAYGGPVLVLNGDLDLVFRLGERRFLEGVPKVRRRTFAWTTHVSNLDRPDAFSEAVRAFEAAIGA